MKDSTHKRHIAKAITWRIVGTVDTILLSWFISGNPYIGLKIGLAEVVSKMFLYYLHERLWFNTKSPDSKKRHLTKTITWRFVGTIDTMILAWLISGNPTTGIQIGMAEVVTKMFLYYVHERAWYRMDFGLNNRKGDRNTSEIKENIS